MRNPALQVTSVSKRFRIGQTHDSLRDLCAAGLSFVLGRRGRREPAETFWALRDLNFSVAEGEAFGIIGPNGAGKSTILKLLAGILRPNEGTISVNGRLAALIEVGAGFHGDLTGRENIFLNGAILGMTRSEVRNKLDAIVDFAGIGRFLEMPVKRYSSGMYARLGFSIAAHVDPKVLLVDEVLSVGDAVFRLRCMQRMRELVEGGTTLILVTHNLEQMQAICGRSLVLEKGRCVFEGCAREAVGHYLSAASRAMSNHKADLTDDAAGGTPAVELLQFGFFNPSGDEVVAIRPYEPVRAQVVFRVNRRIPRLVIEFNMRPPTHENFLSLNSGRDGLTFAAEPGTSSLSINLPCIPLCGGQYFWNVRMWDEQTGENLLDTPVKFPMVIDDEGRATGMVTVDREWVFGNHYKSGQADADAPTAGAQRHEDMLLL